MLPSRLLFSGSPKQRLQDREQDQRGTATGFVKKDLRAIPEQRYETCCMDPFAIEQGDARAELEATRPMKGKAAVNLSNSIAQRHLRMHCVKVMLLFPLEGTLWSDHNGTKVPQQLYFSLLRGRNKKRENINSVA